MARLTREQLLAEIESLRRAVARETGKRRRLERKVAEVSETLSARDGELSETRAQQKAASEILGVISRSRADVQPVLDAVAESAARLCEAFDAAVFRLDGHRLLLVANHGSMPGGAVGEFSIALSRGSAVGRSVLDGRTVHVEDMQASSDEFPEGVQNAKAHGHRTIVSAPLMREGRAIGVITLRRLESRLFSERQVALLQTFADQAVIAIENVRLFRELEARNRDLTEALERQTATGEILRVISRSHTDVQPVFDTIAESAVRLCGGLLGGVYRFDGELIHFVAQHNWSAAGLETARSIYPRLPSRETQIATAILDRRVVHVSDFDDPAVPAASLPLARALGYRSILSRRCSGREARSGRSRSRGPMPDRSTSLRSRCWRPSPTRP